MRVYWLLPTARNWMSKSKKNYKGVDENIVRTKSGKDLLERLNVFDDRLLCSLVHKFGKARQRQLKKQIMKNTSKI